MEVCRERRNGKYEFDFSGQRTRSILENYRLENLLYGFLHDVPVTLYNPESGTGAPVKKIIRSDATMRKTQRRETHRGCRRRQGVKEWRKETAETGLFCVTSRILVRALHRIKPKQGRNCYMTLKNFFVSRATCLVQAYKNKHLNQHNNFTQTNFNIYRYP